MQYYKPEDFTIDDAFITACFKYNEHALAVMGGQNGREKVGRKSGEKVGRTVALSATKKRIIELISEDNTLTAKALADIIGLTEKAIEKNIKQLKETGILKRVGSDKGGYWQIIG